MPAPITVATLQAIMKTYYVDEARLFESDSYENRLLMAVPKNRDAQGDNWKQPLLDQQIAGGSGDWDTTFANTTAGSQVGFTGQWKEHYGMALVEDKAMRLTTSGRGGFQPAFQVAIDSARSHYNDCTNYQLYRSEDGAIGQLASGSSGLAPVFTGGVGTFQFTSDTSPNALQRLKIGSVFNLSAGGPGGIAAGKGAALNAGNWTVTSVTDNGVTATPSVGSVSPSGSAYVYIAGDAQNGVAAASITRALAGFESWSRRPTPSPRRPSRPSTEPSTPRHVQASGSLRRSTPRSTSPTSPLETRPSSTEPSPRTSSATR